MGDANNESSVFDKAPTPAPPAPTPAPPPPTPVPAPPPSNCCDGSQYVKCCACAAQSPAGFSGGFSICKGDNDCDCTSQDPTPGAKRSAACGVQGTIIQVAAHEAQSHVVYISRI